MNIVKNKSISSCLIFVLIIILILGLGFNFGGVDADTGRSDSQVGKYADVYGPVSPSGVTQDNYGNVKPDSESNIYSKTDHGKNDLYVKYSKSITGTATENKFKIDLDIETNDNREFRSVPSDVVLVFDVSGSMDYDMAGNSGGNRIGDSRWTTYKQSMIDFINEFLPAVDGNQLSIVVYGGEGYGKRNNTVHYNLTEGWVNTTKEAIDTFKDYSSTSQLRSDINKKTSANIGMYTNSEAGFQGAYEALDKAKFPYTPNEAASIIFVSDGVANSWYNQSLNNPSGRQERDYIPIANTAALGACSTMMDKFADVYKDDDGNGTSKLYTFAIGNQAADTKILKTNINNDGNPDVTTCFTALDTNGIKEAFKAITYVINHDVDLWKVTDPMSKWVNFEGFEGNYGSASFVTSTGSIEWDLQSIKPDTGGDPHKPKYTYHLSYYVTLNEDAPGFVYDIFYPTNKETTLEYAFSYNNESDKDERTSLFRIPTVKAEKGMKSVKLSKKVKNIKSEYVADSDQKFYFNMWLESGSAQTKSNSILWNGKYDVYNANGVLALKDVDTGSGDEYKGIILKDGQHAIIKGLTPKQKITFEEVNLAPGFTPNWENKSITVSNNTSSTLQEAVCKNNYAVSDLAVEKSNTPGHYVDDAVHYVDRGDNIKYSIDVTNNGSATASGIWIKDAPPEYTEYVNGSIEASRTDIITSAGGAGSDAYVNWFIPELAPDATVTLTFDVKVKGGYDDNHTIPNTARYEETGETTPPPVTGTPEKETNKVENPTAVKSLTVDKSTEDKTLAAGDQVKYTLVLKNTGNVILENVKLKDVIPEWTRYIDGSAEPGAALKTDGQDKKYLEWDVGDMNPDDTFTATFIVELLNGYPNGYVIKNMANTVVGEIEIPSNEVENPTAEVLPETVDPEDDPDGNVMGEEANQKVLGEEAKTDDSAGQLPYLIIMIFAAAAVFGGMIYRMNRKRN